MVVIVIGSLLGGCCAAEETFQVTIEEVSFTTEDDRDKSSDISSWVQTGVGSLHSAQRTM